MFPGRWALFPVFGAVLLIAAGERAWFNRVVLGNPLLVWLGLISYPLYLWHWPLLAFARVAEGDVPRLEVRVSLAVLSIVLAWLTYRLIERPVRRTQPVFGSAFLPLAVMAITGVCGYKIHLLGGVAERFPRLIQELAQYRFPYAESYREEVASSSRNRLTRGSRHVRQPTWAHEAVYCCGAIPMPPTCTQVTGLSMERHSASRNAPRAAVPHCWGSISRLGPIVAPSTMKS